MTLGNANVYMVPFAILFHHTHSTCVLICFCVRSFLYFLLFMALLRCLTNKPFAKKGMTAQMQRPTGPAKACSCGHWEGGSANLLSRLQGVRVLCGRKLLGYMYMFWQKGLGCIKIPCQKGHRLILSGSLSAKFVLKQLWVPCQPRHFLN